MHTRTGSYKDTNGHVPYRGVFVLLSKQAVHVA